MSEYVRGSRRDALTNLLDKGGFDREMEYSSMCTPGGFALAILDVNSFKSINTEHGHDEGDAFLKNLANTLKLLLREDDCILFRIGGDEFSILLRGASSEEKIESIFERLTSELDDLGIEISIAAATHNPEENAEELTTRVRFLTKQAQYKGKREKYPSAKYGKAIREIGRLAAENGIDGRDIEPLLEMDKHGEYY